jgi:hypothetical protein
MQWLYAMINEAPSCASASRKTFDADLFRGAESADAIELNLYSIVTDPVDV